jgi:hypothetical protein
MPPNQTAKDMTPDTLPEGTRPEEFLTDEDLAGYYGRQLEQDPANPELKAQFKAAKLAAAITKANQEEQALVDAAEIAAAEPPADEEEEE